jgi:hypothetical protein
MKRAAGEILTRVENIPSILQQASENLENPPAPFATVAAQNLDGIREHLRTMAKRACWIDHSETTRVKRRN